MSPNIFCIGANHRTADIVHREGFFLAEEKLARALSLVKMRHNLSELLVLSTCNRFELVGVGHCDSASALEIWLDLHAQANGSVPLNRADLERMSYKLWGQDAVRHLFMVAASLDSLVPGETQITGQFRDAVGLAQRENTLGPILSRLAQEAIASAKRVRSQTAIGQRTVSISHAAVSLAKRMFHDLALCRFLILGAGEMARVAAEHAKTYQPKRITIANRTANRAYELAQHIGATEGFGLEDLPELIARADVVITATASPIPVVTRDIVKRALNQRDTSQPLFLVDISLPRNIESTCRSFDDVYLFDIDDLKQVVDQNLSERHAAALEATVIIDQATGHFDQWLSTQEVTPVMEAWRGHIQATLEREASKTLNKEIFQNLSAKQREALQDMLDAVTSRLAGDLAQGLRKSSPDAASVFAAGIMQIFGLAAVTKKGPK